MKPQKKEKKSYVKSSKTKTSRTNMLIYGPPKSGKTYVAATASKFWPEVEGEEATLEDMIWLEVDEGATDGFEPVGITIPSIVDFNDIIQDEGVSDGIRVAVEQIYDLVDPTKIVVVDTISMLDRLIVGWWNTRSADKWAVFRNVLDSHRRLYSALSMLPCDKIFLCHSKASLPATDEAKTVKQAQTSLNPEIRPDITGQAITIYVGNVSIEAVVQKKKVPGGDYKRVLLPFGNATYEGGSRFESLLDKEEPPHLGNLLRKIGKRNEQ